MSYITCTQKKTKHKVHVSVCERCKGMDCPDYRNYMQLSLFPSLVPDKQIRRKLCSEKEAGAAGPVSKPPEQMSWLEKPDLFSKP